MYDNIEIYQNNYNDYYDDFNDKMIKENKIYLYVFVSNFTLNTLLYFDNHNYYKIQEYIQVNLTIDKFQYYFLDDKQLKPFNINLLVKDFFINCNLNNCSWKKILYKDVERLEKWKNKMETDIKNKNDTKEELKNIKLDSSAIMIDINELKELGYINDNNQCLNNQCLNNCKKDNFNIIENKQLNKINDYNTRFNQENNTDKKITLNNLNSIKQENNSEFNQYNNSNYQNNFNKDINYNCLNSLNSVLVTKSLTSCA